MHNVQGSKGFGTVETEEKGFAIQASRIKFYGSRTPRVPLDYPHPHPPEHCMYLYCFTPIVVRCCLELFCFLSFVSFVLRHLYSGTHRRNRFFRTIPD